LNCAGVTGPGVNICDQCVTLSAKVIAKEPVPQFRSLDDMSDEELLADVLRVLASREQVEGAVMDRVRRLRTRGVTLHRIGEALGMSRQSAWERFSTDAD
jgi:hypothetical protein